MPLTGILAFASTVLAQAAGNVELKVQNGNAIIIGDSDDNNIIVIRGCCRTVIVTGRAKTTVNGHAGRSEVDGVGKGVIVRTNLGDDFVRIEVAPGSQPLSGDLIVDAGAGNDIIEILGVKVGNDTRIDAGYGDDIVFVDGVLTYTGFINSVFAGRFTLIGDAGDDLFEFHHTVFKSDVDVAMGSGIDGVCNTEDSEIERPDQARFEGGLPTGFPGDGFVAPLFVLAHRLSGFEFYPDDCAYLGGRY
jgi:hypothetical protein